MPFVETGNGVAFMTGARAATAQGVVVWDGQGSEPARPAGFSSVKWISPVAPEQNPLDGDTWVTPAS